MAAVFPCPKGSSSSDIPPQRNFWNQVCIRQHCFNVELAVTEKERIKGLQGRAHLPEESGMLFIFSREEYHRFWMKETLLALDVIWINQKKEIVDIKTLLPCGKDPCSSFAPEREALYVLEINAGVAQELLMKKGDPVEFISEGERK